MLSVLIFIEYTIGTDDLWSVNRSLLGEIVENEFLILFFIFIVVIASFVVLMPIITFLLSWGTYEIAGLRHSLRVRSILDYFRHLFSPIREKDRIRSIIFAIGNFIAIIRMQFRRLFLEGVGGLVGIVYVFSLILVLFLFFPSIYVRV